MYPNPIIIVFIKMLDLYEWLLIIYGIMSWFVGFNIVNRNQVLVRKFMEICYVMTEPILAKIRPYMPDVPGVDLSFIVLFFGLNILQALLYTIA